MPFKSYLEGESAYKTFTIRKNLLFIFGKYIYNCAIFLFQFQLNCDYNKKSH